MREKIFTKSMKILITGTLLIMAAKLPDGILIGFTAGWIAVTAAAAVLKSAGSRERKQEETAPEPEAGSGTSGEHAPEPRMSAEEEAGIWYRTVLRNRLAETVTDLNVRGYKQLIINEEGELTVPDGGCGSVGRLPGRAVWHCLTEEMNGDGLAAYETDGGITVAW